MKIGVDIRSLAQGRNTGVEEYTKKLLTTLFDIDRENDYVLFLNAWKNTDIDLSWVQKYPHVQIKKYAIPNKLLNFSLWFFQYPKIDKLCGGVDVFFMPNSNFCALSRNTKLFFTVHDLSFLHYKETFSLKRRIWHFFVNPRLLIKRADHIFAVSEFTKKDVCYTFGIDDSKVTVTTNGLTSVTGMLDRNSMELVQTKEKYNLPYNFILYFGTIEPRKNILSIITAFEVFKENGDMERYKLVIAGATGWKSQKITDAVLNSSCRDDIIVINDVNEREKESLYALASVFVYPSFFEGFGFPPLEAIACSTPTIVSYTTSLPEVVKEHAVMIDPLRQEELVIAFDQIIKNEDVSYGKSSEYAKDCTWSQSVEKIQYIFS